MEIFVCFCDKLTLVSDVIMTEIEKTFELYQLEEIVSVTFQQYCEVVLFLATLHLSIYRLSFELMTLHLNTRDVDEVRGVNVP